MISDTETATWWSCCVHTRAVALETMWQQGQFSSSSCFHPDAGSCLEKPVSLGRLIEAFISTGPPCCVASCRAPRGEQHSFQNTPGSFGTWHFWALVFFAAMCGCASHWGVRPLNPHGGLSLFCLFAALCPAYQGGQRAALAQPVVLQQGLIPLNVDTAMSTPELSRHPF